MYSKTFKKDRYNSIMGITNELSELEPGASLKISGLSPETLHETRYLLYDYLHHLGTKSLFRLKSEDGLLVIKRLGLPGTVQVVMEKGKDALDGLLKELITLDGSEKAEEKLAEWIKERKITAIEASDLFVRYRKVMS